MLVATIVPLLFLGLASCARPGDCGDAIEDASRLRCDASHGIKSAQLELAKRLESGIGGLTKDPKRAAELYRAAGMRSIGTTYVYSPPVGKNGRSMVIPVRSGADKPGLPEAHFRLGLMYLEGRGVRFDYAKGRSLIEAAASAGHVAAQTKLRALDLAPRIR